MMLLAIGGDERKDLVQKSLPRLSFKLCLTLLSLLEFINQNIHYERLFHIMRLRANAVDALDEGDELSLLVNGHQELVCEEACRPFSQCFQGRDFVALEEHDQLGVHRHKS